MARDVRLEGPSFNALVIILAEALPDLQQIRTIATKLNIVGKVALTGNADDQWTSLLHYAGEDSKVLDELLDLADGYLKTTTYYTGFLSWRGQGSDAKLDRAVSEVQKFRNALFEVSDPRKVQHMTTVRLAILEIKEMIEAAPGKMIEAAPGKVASGPNILAGTTEVAAAARGKILDACGDTLKALDQLIIDIAEAGQQSDQIQREYGVLEASIVGRSVVPHLLEDRRRVDRGSEVLLQVIGEQLAQLEIAVLGSSDQGQAAPQQRAGP